MRYYICVLAFLLLLVKLSNAQSFYGFWEGPHPTDKNSKFVFYIFKSQDQVKGKAYWIHNDLFNSEFNLDSIEIDESAISIFIPNWNCYYRGKVVKDHIKGVFMCKNELPDSVTIIRNNSLGKLVYFPIADMENANFVYKYETPKSDRDIKSSGVPNANDSSFINKTVNEIISNKYGRINAYLVYRNGKFICEEYFYGYNKTMLTPVESVTKSISSLITGIAIDKAYINSVDEPIFKYFPEYDSLRNNLNKNIRIKHILTMSAGYSEDMQEILQSKDRLYYCLSRELKSKPGKQFSYDGGSTQLLAGIIKNATGKHIDKFGEEYLFNKLNIKNYNWEVYKQNGYPLTGGSLELLPRDMLKIGLLVLNEGKWNGTQIIPNKWIRQSTSPLIQTNNNDDKYGYQWWISTIKSGNVKLKLIWANGWGSQFIFILPELDMVIVTTGSNHQYGNSWDILNMLKDNLKLLK